MLLKEQAYAKINLFLNILSRREDGYHEIQSVMQTVSLADLITLELSDGESQITVTCEDKSVPTDDTNLAVRAIHAFYDAAELEVPTVSLTIDKHIPVSAGLAGGSADAAAVLRMLNRAHNALLPETELLKAAASLGADVPFCLHGGTVVCQGIGDKLTACPAIPDCYILVAAGDEQSATPAAYRMADSHFGDTFPEHSDTFSSLLLAIADRDKDAVCRHAYNIFEETTLPTLPKATELKRLLPELHAACTLMSGSGPAVFGIYQEERAAKIAGEILTAFGYRATVCTPVRY